MKELRNRYRKETPAVRYAPGQSVCRACNKRIPKGELCIELAMNGGPTGTSHLCLRHANLIATEIIELVALAQALLNSPTKYPVSERWSLGGKNVR